ncbi:bifunctional phosphoribosylaminoimidazolecarboxamide formyltransferase/IMP cyclohydrolase [Sunxiuqinia elliptica]|uniref:Bifunctional purine biosynthesis protein PurH n=1 Tax=Sunxiuqinia elliptica TaxID=655355 RepID=A0A4R6HAQ7_9BACT|nr:bifunctional phosphoribosylaminoimidazolecarboxamide formyltransferase/IMP cyclohydrolase [Sunxiuqinia elliptica]TDO04715.1 phosphoribosylaminoimidazolecarboxamide formyltransferase/IMP cyclohydrolase [Sunxiuqinia elliptica]TDO64263.1 phosphoribosylaminoimidazolecarboxamide formyltransferase/IMP cyclohydrolase [Sunxiuqinia elliptica]
MKDLKKIKSALISVYHKDKLDTIVKKLDQLGVQIYSTGGTQSFIESIGTQVTAVESLTSYPSILGGRVKTLHPKVFGGILNRRDNEGDQKQIAEYEIPEIDLVIVDLYPFEETVASGASEQDIIEKIDIGGIALIRAAAKNFNDVIIVSSRNQYDDFIQLLNEKNGESSLDDRKAFARKAFATSSHYDSAIFNYFNEGITETNRVSLNDGHVLRYGENPHQSATFYKFDNADSQTTLANAEVLQGKALSYNNLLDADASWKAASDAYHAVTHLDNKVAVSVIKHLNPCGLAVTNDILQSLELAWAGDPISAYGSIICFTDTVTADVANWFGKKFVEIIIAPEFTPEALEIFSKKKNLRLLVTPIKAETTGEKLYRSISGGMLVQDEDEGMDQEFKNVTKIQFDNNKLNLAKFGITACKHLKSNAIALVTENSDGSFWLTGAGMGQPNRLDSLRQLTIPRFNLKEGITIEDSVLISDAFFPFRDSIEAANEYGVKYIVEPGGSIRDDEVIEACDEFGIAMLFTGRRHFKH